MRSFVRAYVAVKAQPLEKKVTLANFPSCALL